ncbi:MAG: O-antigen/teichoic acid export membrane protein [Yoonia sp.]|jgi:O-antigen/teichoic acid export membrane protein
MTLFFLSRLLGSFLALVTFMALPRMMQPEAYGHLNLAVQAGTAAFAILLGWVPASMVRFHKAADMGGMSTSWLLGAAAAGATGIAAAIVLWVVLGGTSWGVPLMPVLVFGLGHGLNEIGLSGLRAHGQAKRFAVCVLFRPIAGLAVVAIILGVGLDPSLAVLGLGGAAGLSGIWAIMWLLKQSPAALPDRKTFQRLLRFGVPLAIVAAGASINVLVTQSILANLVGLAAVGTFSAAMTLAMRSISMTMIMLGRSVSPTIYEAYEEDGHESSDAAFERYASFLLLLSVPLVLILTVGAIPMSQVLFDENFRNEVSANLPWVAAAAFISGIQGSYLAYVFSIAEKTWVQLLLMAGNLLVHASVTFVMVSEFGALGAALGTLISAAISLVTYGYFASRIRPLNIPWIELRMQFLALLAATPFGVLSLYTVTTGIAFVWLGLTIFTYFLILYLNRQIAIRLVIKGIGKKLKKY